MTVGGKTEANKIKLKTRTSAPKRYENKKPPSIPLTDHHKNKNVNTI